MNLPTDATSVTDTAKDQAVINELLGQEGEVSEAPETEVATEEPSRASETAEESSEQEATGETAEESSDEGESHEADEQTEEEGPLTLTEADRDYSKSAYEKAAKHYSRTHGVQLDPDDPAHRILLKEIMDRGRALDEQRAEREAAEKQAQPDEEKAEEKAAEFRPPTDQEIAQGIERIQAVAKARVVPQVAKHVANRFVKALWPDQEIAVTQEQANDITSAMHEFFLMALDDAAPSLYQMVNKNLATDQTWGAMHEMSVRERAIETLYDMKDTGGNNLYPDIESMIESGTLKSVINSNPFLAAIKSGNGKDPVKNRVEQYKAAYKIARGEKTVEQVKSAVQTGKKQATETAKKVAASRVAPGGSGRGFSQPATEGERLVNEITRGSGSTSKFSQAIKTQLRK